MKLFQKPIDCYDHPTRYRTLIVLHIIDTITFIIRFTVICIDLSKSQEQPSNVVYPVFIFLLEMISTLPFFVSDILYAVVRCFKNDLFGDDQHPVCCKRRTALRVATLTCFPCQCYRDHPQGIQFTRVIILIICFIIRFIAFILGASCATTYHPRCVPYAAVSSLALVPSFLTFIIEWLHFHLLWNFEPVVGSSLTKRRDRSHLRFVSHKLVNEKRTQAYASSLCERGKHCDSNSLNHTILYHSIRQARVENNQIIIVYHVTTAKRAIKIAQKGFPLNQQRQVNNEIYFTRTVEEKESTTVADQPAIICVRLNLGLVLEVDNEDQLDFSKLTSESDLPQTLKCINSGKIKVRFPGQIENWVIRLPTENDGKFDPSYYDGCI